MKSQRRRRKQARGSNLIESSISKFAEAASTFVKDASATLAGHEQRLDSIDAMADTLQNDIRDLRKSTADDAKFLHGRIDEVQKQVSEKLDAQTQELTSHFDTGMAKVTEGQGKLSLRIGKLEKWRWVIMGGGIVVSAIVLDVLVKIFYNPIAQFVLKVYGH